MRPVLVNESEINFADAVARGAHPAHPPGVVAAIFNAARSRMVTRVDVEVHELTVQKSRSSFWLLPGVVTVRIISRE